MGNSYPFKIGTKLGDAAGPDYRPDGRARPGHLTGLQNRASIRMPLTSPADAKAAVYPDAKVEVTHRTRVTDDEL
jgi:hypothetical protein